MNHKSLFLLIAFSLSSLVEAGKTSTTTSTSTTTFSSSTSLPSCLQTYTGKNLNIKHVCPTYDEYQFFSAITGEYYVIHCNYGFQDPGYQPPGVTDATGCFNACITAQGANLTDAFWGTRSIGCHCVTVGAFIKPGDNYIAFVLSDQPSCSSASKKHHHSHTKSGQASQSVEVVGSSETP